MKIISATGTKGKSTVVRVISSVLQRINEHPVLHVDTHGWYINDTQLGSLKDSNDIWGLVPTVSPGRFLYAIKDDFPNCDAVLETALGSSAASGLGYKRHNIGIFTNVLEDHLGSSRRLKTREDIALAKKFIFARIAPEGTVIFNADDEYVVKMLRYVSKKMQPSRIPVTLDKSNALIDLDEHVATGGCYVTIEDDYVVRKSSNGTTKLVSIPAVSWTFNGKFMPSLYNLSYVCAALLAYHESDQLPQATIDAIESSTLDPYGGRLTRLRSKNGVELIIDYAHEKYSFVEVGKLAKSLAGPQGTVYGVLRIAYDRTDELIEDTAKTIAKSYDKFVIYDKIDGHLKKAKEFKVSKRFTQEVGKTSLLFATALEKHTSDVTRIIREDEALAYAAQHAKSGDVVVCIPSDDIHRSVDFVKDIFEAEFI